jgi:hypothetical protein
VTLRANLSAASTAFVPSRAWKLHLVAVAARPQNYFIEVLKKTTFGRRMEIEAMDNRIAFEVGN